MELEEDWEEWDPERGSFLHHAFAGSLAGVAEHTAMFPVDTYKTHCQVARGPGGPPTFWSLVKSRGPLGMWRGSRAMFMACIPSHAMYFSVYEAAKEQFGANAPGHTPVPAAMAGALATVLHDGVLTPMDVVKQRLQLGYYAGIVHCVKSIIAEEGVRALFRSYPTTVLMNIPYAAAVVASNESLKEVLNPGRNHDMLAYLLSGAGAGALAATVTNPLDVIKSRLQTQRCRPAFSPATLAEARVRSVSGGPATHLGGRSAAVFSSATATPEYNGFLDTGRKIFLEEGHAGFFKGLRARVLVHTPSMGISWATYEFVKNFLVTQRS